MEYTSDKMMHGVWRCIVHVTAESASVSCNPFCGYKNESTPMEDVSAETSYSEIDVKDAMKTFTRSSGDDAETKAADWKDGENGAEDTAFEEIDISGEVNMEASIAPDDVIRAGGFGARDDISSLLPVASDATDFEASIRDARDYEEPQEEVSRPGLGWTGASKGE